MGLPAISKEEKRLALTRVLESRTFGRSDQLRQAGFAGNFSLTEALALCEACGIPAMLAHHYGMFAFNTADPSVIDAAASAAPLQLVRAETKVAYRLAFG